MNLAGQAVGIDQTVNAGGTLAGDNGTNLGAGAADFQTVLCQKCDHRINVLVGNTLNFNGLTGRHSDFTGTELFRCVGNRTAFSGGNFTVTGQNTAVELVRGCFIPQAAQTLYPGHIFCRNCTDNRIDIFDIHKQNSFCQDYLEFVLSASYHRNYRLSRDETFVLFHLRLFFVYDRKTKRHQTVSFCFGGRQRAVSERPAAIRRQFPLR